MCSVLFLPPVSRLIIVQISMAIVIMHAVNFTNEYQLPISLLYFTKRNPLFAVSVSKLIIFYRLSLGDVTDTFCLQSVSMPLSYALALNDLGDQFVHRYLGQEPSGGHYNEIKLDHKSEF